MRSYRRGNRRLPNRRFPRRYDRTRPPKHRAHRCPHHRPLSRPRPHRLRPLLRPSHQSRPCRRAGHPHRRHHHDPNLRAVQSHRPRPRLGRRGPPLRQRNRRGPPPNRLRFPRSHRNPLPRRPGRRQPKHLLAKCQSASDSNPRRPPCHRSPTPLGIHDTPAAATATGSTRTTTRCRRQLVLQFRSILRRKRRHRSPESDRDPHSRGYRKATRTLIVRRKPHLSRQQPLQPKPSLNPPAPVAPDAAPIGPLIVTTWRPHCLHRG
ncbi:hypothetical protein LAUMK41_05654 [Mycobacterium attenuatum]|nr:hypothetical protein LAUMK41_05654 [Mycobacterium attenuatum]